MSTLPLWRSFHLHYHGDRDRLLLELVRPLLAALLADGGIDRFFFVRYRLAGPHIRLRLRHRPGEGERVTEVVTDAAAAFLDQHPSLVPLSADEIRRENAGIRAWDPAEQDDAVVPDNTVREVPFEPETSRYGGPERLAVSLDFFCLSSLQALGFLAGHTGAPRGRHLASAFRLLARQSLRLAADTAELPPLLGYALRGWGEALEGAARRGEQVFEQQHETFRELLRIEVEDLLAPRQEEWPETAARRLARELAPAGAAARLRIAASHLHMTANRLGLRNPEEVYLGTMLLRTAAALAAADPGLWRGLRDRLTSPPEQSGDGLADLLPAAWTVLAQAPAAGSPAEASSQM